MRLREIIIWVLLGGSVAFGQVFNPGITPPVTDASALTTGTLPDARLSTVPTTYGKEFWNIADLSAFWAKVGGTAAITGGAISGITDLAIADGGTGASTAAAVRANIGIGDMVLEPVVDSNFTWTGALLNARMCLMDGILYIAEYENDKIAVYDVSRNPAVPVQINRFVTGDMPRDIAGFGKYIFVACRGDDVVNVYDVTIPSTVSYVGQIATSSEPKRLELVGNVLYVATTLPSPKITKYRIDRLTQYPTANDFHYTTMGSVTTSGIGDLAINDLGIMAVTGGTDTISFVGTSGAMVVDSTLQVVGAAFSCVAYKGNNVLLAVDRDNDKLYVINSDWNDKAVITSITISDKPEQIIVIGDRAYIPTLRDTGIQCYLDVVDISNLAAPVLDDSLVLSTGGAGFLAWQPGYLYVSGHYTPYNIEIIKIPDGSPVKPQPDLSFVSGPSAILPLHSTWTPVIGDGTNAYTQNYTYASYVKMEQVVTVTGFVSWNSIGSAGASQLQISGLPYDATSDTYARFSAAIGQHSGCNATQQLTANLDEAASVLKFYDCTDNASPLAIAANAQSATGAIQFSMTYITDE